MPRHARVVEATPLLNPQHARGFLVTLGWIETLLAMWVLAGRFPLQAAFAQTALLIVMNAGGILWARHIIPDPIGMLFQNFAFVVLIWICSS